MKMEMVTATANPTQIQSRYNCSDSDFLIKQKIIVENLYLIFRKVPMYYLVPYISIKNENNIIYIESSINENYIKITDSELQSEFYK